MPNPFIAILLLAMLYCSCFALSLMFSLLYTKKTPTLSPAEEECTYKIVEQPVKRRRRRKPVIKNTVLIRGKIVNDTMAKTEEPVK